MSQIEFKIEKLREILGKNNIACFSNNVDEMTIRPGKSIIPGYFSFCEAARTQLGLPPVEGLAIYNKPFPNPDLFIHSACCECPALAPALTQLNQVIASHTINDLYPVSHLVTQPNQT